MTNTKNLPRLQGSEKQVKWATEIREEMLNKGVDKALTETSASWFIDWRDNSNYKITFELIVRESKNWDWGKSTKFKVEADRLGNREFFRLEEQGEEALEEGKPEPINLTSDVFAFKVEHDDATLARLATAKLRDRIEGKIFHLKQIERQKEAMRRKGRRV
jgi:hypothetical protein